MGISDEKYVSITTYRRNGDAVSSPVWIAPLGDGTAGFTTGSDSGKVKRIRNNPAVSLRPCDVRGRVREGAVAVNASASVVTDADFAPVQSAIRKKYGLMAAMLGVTASIGKLFKRGAAANCGIVVRFDV